MITAMHSVAAAPARSFTRPRPAAQAASLSAVAQQAAFRTAAFRTTGAVRGSAARTGVVAMSAPSPAGSLRFDIQGKHLEVTDALRDYVQKKIGSAVEQFQRSDGVREVSVRMSARGGAAHTQHGPSLHKAEVTVKTRNGVIRAEREESSMYASIDKAADVISRGLQKMKERDEHGGVKKHGSKTPVHINEAVTDDVVDELMTFKTPDARSLPVEVVRRKFFACEKMSLEQAISNLEDLDHGFYVFKDQANGELQVLYRRNAGGYGLIIPREEAASSS